jgi:predicted CXXCH cytochrome family protein
LSRIKRAWAIGLSICALAVSLTACDPAARYKTLHIFFDGVPNPDAAKKQVPAAGATAPAADTRISFSQHGPYAAKLCTACHEPQTNALIAPATELCFHCHELNLNKTYVHGPIASGGCLVCHDPHGSRYRYLLVSESDTFCLHCHDQQSIAQSPTHKNSKQQCTVCHDAHMSNKKYLLK